MIVDVVAIVREVAPGLLSSPQPSVVCVRTTRPKYLVFDRDRTRPACVVEIGDTKRLQRIHRVLQELHRRLPGLIPQPLCCTRWQSEVDIHIQAGVPGMPWFRVADELATPAEWRALLARIVKVVASLHAASRDVPGWVGTVSLSGELREQLRISRLTPAVVPDPILRDVEEWASRVDDLSPIHAHWQHGDFSLNNVMVSPNAISVIDFEEFGCTSMPLHDEFGLAVSFPLSQGRRCPIPFPECVHHAIAPAVRERHFDETAVRALFLHHLLWRINHSRMQPSRGPLVARLLSVLERVASPRTRWRPALESAFT